MFQRHVWRTLHDNTHSAVSYRARQDAAMPLQRWHRRWLPALASVALLMALGVPLAVGQTTTTLVSTNRAGTRSGNGNSDKALHSADGRFVAFQSRATTWWRTATMLL
jgi:hypothetical protein